MKQIRLLRIVFLAGLLAACSSTQVTNEWKASGYSAKDYRKILVIGILRDAAQGLRAAMERHLVDDLKAEGYNVFSALARYGAGHFRNLSEEQRIAKLKADSIDAVLTIVLLDKVKERHYVPGQVLYTPYATYQSRLWGYYNTMASRVETPGYFEENTRYFWESNFYDIATGRLVYSVQTQSFDAASSDKQAHHYGLEITRSMRKNGVLPARTP